MHPEIPSLPPAPGLGTTNPTGMARQTCMTTSAKAILIIFMWSVDANATAQPATAQVGQKISAAPSACTTEEKFPSNLIPNLSAAPTQRFHIQKQPERQSTPLPEGSGNPTPPEPGS